MNIPEGLRYTPEHEWVEVNGDRARVGITDFAQDALGDLVYVDLPEIGASLESMQACCEIESTKSVSEVYAPLAGTVLEVNETLVDEPEQVNADPYGQGWIFTIRMTNPTDADSLLDAAAYQKLLEEA